MGWTLLPQVLGELEGAWAWSLSCHPLPVGLGQPPLPYIPVSFVFCVNPRAGLVAVILKYEAFTG